METNRYFSPDKKLEVVKRYAAGESPGALGREYSIRPTLVHQWVSVYRECGLAGLRGPGRPSRESLAKELLPNASEIDASHSPAAAQRRIALLEQKLAQQSLEIDFFKHALRHFETSLQLDDQSGATAPTPSSGPKRNRKAD